MSEYLPPLRDIDFALHHTGDIERICTYPGFEHVDPDIVSGAVAEFGRFASEVIAPTNRDGDLVGSRLEDDGTVVTPPGFADVYRRYVEAGWGGVPFDPDYGGGGFPWLVAVALQEILTSANMGFSLCPLLTQGAIDMLTHHGSEEQKERYLPKMVSGEWTGTMNLTEPDAGSDVGALRTRAEPAGDGTYRIRGQKIYITYGGHDMAENIIHLVLARTPDAPPGTKGISCFIVPDRLLDDDGTPGERNDVRVVSLEHKMGIHASPTCVMAYGEHDGAVGYLIGEENQGMRYMFTMMNNARLSVGLEGLAIAERAYQQALTYAQERAQGRAVGAPAGTSSPIIEHPDVRRMLVHMRSHIEAMRGLVFLNAAATDSAVHGPDEATRVAGDERAALLTPLSKAWCTDLGVELTSLALQIHGGMGYVEETGVAQHYRDARIAPIYEGTNGIQAIDLVGRKLPMRAGGVFADLAADITADIARLDTADVRQAAIAERLAEALEVTVETARTVGAMADPNDALAGATPFLTMVATVVGGWVHARSAVAAAAALAAGDGEAEFLEAKLVTAHYYATQILPRVAGLAPSVAAGADDLFALTPAQLAG